jgi:hypothetical protein
VVDLDAEGLLDRVDHTLGSVVERGIDLRLADRRDVDPEVAWERDEEPGLRVGIDVGDHDRVGTLTARIVRFPEVRRILLILDERPCVGTDDQEVGRLTLPLFGQVDDDALRRVDLVVDEPVRVSDAAGSHGERGQQRDEESTGERAQ